MGCERAPNDLGVRRHGRRHGGPRLTRKAAESLVRDNKRRLKRAQSATVALSIDWDFFTFNALEANAKVTVQRKGETEDVHGVVLFDWGHNEGHGGALSQLLWLMRWSVFTRCGIDPKAILRWPEAYRCLAPADFDHHLRSRMTWALPEDLEIGISDSHALGYRTIARAATVAGGPVDVVHFDAHHDLAYSPGAVKKAKVGDFDCGSWLYGALAYGLVHRVTVVYPDWKGMRDRAGHMEHLSRYDVRFTTWSEWLAGSAPKGHVSHIHLARSGSWTAPWLDVDFQTELVDRLSSLSAYPPRCLDCDPTEPKVGGLDACSARKWDEEAARKHTAEDQERMDAFEARRVKEQPA